MLKKATSKSKSVSTTATAARNCNTVTESQPDEPEEKIQVQEQDIGESHQLQSSPLSALGLSTEANTVKESQSTRQDISPTNFGDSTAKVVHEICGTERNELRRKAQVLTASLQQAKRNNMDVSYQQHQLEELQSELCRLLHIEAQLKEYEKRSVESIEHELQVLQQEVANLSKCVQAALQEELDWIDRMEDSQREERL
ncbi:unnamed protein product [Peronospora belbahrii]|uniref:Uncharacterized protein n=1 Tax=Peronospora belbahrii TaxID=622444 RepID=A0ABN8D987_9STRA|nr:unnamed protein product [Peronospora belbahrii]